MKKIVIILYILASSCSNEKSEIASLLPTAETPAAAVPPPPPPPAIIVPASEYAQIEQSKSIDDGGFGAGQQNITFDSSVASGSTVVVFAMGSIYGGVSTTTILFDNLNNNYVLVNQTGDPDPSGSTKIFTFVAENVSGGSLTINADWNNQFGNYRGLVIIEVKNTILNSYLGETHNLQSNTINVTDSVFSPALNLTSTEVLMISFGIDTFTLATPDVGTGFTNEGVYLNYGGPDGIRLESLRITQVGNYAPTFTPKNTSNHISSAVFLKEKSH